MRRRRLETTAYGSVPTISETEPLPVPVQSDADRQLVGSWVTRRSAFSPALVRDASVLFEQRLGRKISEGEARNMLGSLTDYLWMLIKWETDPPAATPAETVDLSRPKRLSKRTKPKAPPRPRGRPKRHSKT
jgi:hypothetical protein